MSDVQVYACYAWSTLGLRLLLSTAAARAHGRTDKSRHTGCVQIPENIPLSANPANIKCTMDLSDESVLELVDKESRNKQTTGSKVKARLLFLSSLLCAPLSNILLHPEDTARQSSRHFVSPLAYQQHVQAIITTVKYLGKRAPPQCKSAWDDLHAKAEKKCKDVQQQVRALFTNATDAIPKTVTGYVNDIMNMSAICNVENIMDVLTNPSQYRIHLHNHCNSFYTESTYISRLLSI